MEDDQQDREIDGVAIVGMVGRFPGAPDVDALWNNICEGKESITYFTDQQLHPSIAPELRSDPGYVRAKGVIDDVDRFDAAFFGINPREAEVMDPQQRVFLETAWEALESAGYAPGQHEGSVGVFAGMNYNTYLLNNVLPEREALQRVGQFQTMLANEKDFLASRVSYKLNLTGPSVSVYTACSTSLVAVCQAFQSLMTFQCDMALAGGVSISVPQNSGYLYQEGSMLSPDGHCRPFDANAQGTTFNNGVGIVVLKRLEEALEDGDYIHAVIRGVGLNNDGAGKVSFTAPSVTGQAEAVAMALAQADVDPRTVSYVETHGTGTPLGDPIEVEALRKAFDYDGPERGWCAIGSIKGNVGHLVHAAGVAGLIKTAMSLEHRKLPPSLYFERPNPKIDFANSPFFVNAELRDWESGGGPRRAGVSSFGVGGTNAHVLLEEAPPRTAGSLPARSWQILPLSARSKESLEAATVLLADDLASDRGIELADVAHTLQVGRKSFNHRRVVVCADIDGAVESLRGKCSKAGATRSTNHTHRPVAFIFPGQGAQYPHMGSGLYKEEPQFRAQLDLCAEILTPELGLDLRDILFPEPGNAEAAAEQLAQTQFTQPALFSVEYALARLWQAWGINPCAMAGHSIGEYVAACLAGVFSLEDALRLVARRGRLMQSQPAGGMLSVRMPAAELKRFTSPTVAIAAENAPAQCVLAGPLPEIETLLESLQNDGVACRQLRTSHAFHSSMMDAIVEPFRAEVEKVKRSEPCLPFVSTLLGEWITPEQAIDPAYWSAQLRGAVRFADAVERLWEEPERVLLEVGPRETATALARQNSTRPKEQIALGSMGDGTPGSQEAQAVQLAIGQLWASGVAISWQQLRAGEQRLRVRLPTYSFEKKRYWIEAPDPVYSGLEQTCAATGDALPVPSIEDPYKQSQECEVQMTTADRRSRIGAAARAVIEEASGMDLSDADESMTFFELGLDSLFLTQASLALKREFSVEVAFRQLLEELQTLETLVDYLADQLPTEAYGDAPAEAPGLSASQPVDQEPGATAPVQLQPTTANARVTGGLEQVIQEQLRIMNTQLDMLRGGGAASLAPASAPTANSAPRTESQPRDGLPVSGAEAATRIRLKPRISIAVRERTHAGELSSAQQAKLEEIVNRYTERTARSKTFTQSHRARLADARSVSGFNPLWKEMVYPIVTDRSDGSKLWDLDGNEYVDFTNGFGPILLGHSPDFVTEAVKKQLDLGIETGPQTPLAGEVADLICEMTGAERMSFCNTGSEAVLAALRIARTVSGRTKVVMFTGAYHGICDEVIVRAAPGNRTIPAAPGIPPSAVSNVIVLDYGVPESLEAIRAQAGDLAAVLVEPVQSRCPQLQPTGFLHGLRDICDANGVALIMDEIVTGFRTHPGGAQAHFGVRADIATYGKVAGGGHPIGIVAGRAQYLDALDGGFWQFGDDSVPEVGVTFFAGTFVRHPLALAATKAVLTHLKTEGPALQERLNRRTDEFATAVQSVIDTTGAPLEFGHFGSFFYLSAKPEAAHGALLYYLLRERGIHLWEYRPGFLTTAHSDADLQQFVTVLAGGIEELQSCGLMSSSIKASVTEIAAARGGHSASEAQPPVPGARLGRDPQGEPAWYVPDPDRPGKYLEVGSAQ